MAITIRQLHPLFCAEIGGIDTGQPMDDAAFAEIRATLDAASGDALRYGAPQATDAAYYGAW